MKFNLDQAINAMRRYHVVCENGCTETIAPYLKEHGYTGKLFGDCCMKILKDTNYIYSRSNKEGRLEYLWRPEIPFDIENAKNIAELAFDLQKEITRKNMSFGRQKIKEVKTIEECKEEISTDKLLTSLKSELSNLRELNQLFNQQMSIVNAIIETLDNNGLRVHFDPVSLSATVEI